ncbi:MAG: S1 RNA-binding domain-containing protein [Cyanobacteria bacterium REEB67]|nr:S1 RNA-binding domain-containing protein [Cyanobacteria bacterium REEB67]
MTKFIGANSSANGNNASDSNQSSVDRSSKGPNSKTPYKRKYGFDLLKQIDPFFLEEGEFEAAKAQHEMLSQLFEGTSVLANAGRKDFIEGTVVASTRDGYLVNIGRKYDAIVPLAEAGNLAISDTSEFYVIDGANKAGLVVLSANMAKGWRELEAAQETDQIFQARAFKEAITKRNQKSAGLRIVFEGGILNGIRGFIPNNEIARNVQAQTLVGQLIDVCILKAESQKGSEYGNLIASHKAAQGMADQIMISNMQTETMVSGTVIDFIKASPKDHKMSALVRLENGLVAMLHRSETVDSRDTLTEMYEVGSVINAAVRSVDIERKRIGLSLKLAAQMESFAQLAPNKIVEAEVLRETVYGYFCGIGGGLEGLLHKSDLVQINGRSESFKSGDKIEVMILNYREDGSRLALGRKQLFN